MDEIIFFTLEKFYELCFTVDDKLASHLEKIESGCSSMKNINPFSKIFLNLYILFLFFFKTYLLRLFNYVHKDIYDSYIQDKEYSLLITLTLMLSFNVCSSTIFRTPNKKNLSWFERTGLSFFKFLLDIINSYKFFFFFHRFRRIHFDFFSQSEVNLHLQTLQTILSLLWFFLVDFFLANSSSTFARAVSYFYTDDLDNKSKIRDALLRKMYIFSFRLGMFYLIIYKRFSENFQIFEGKSFEKGDIFMFLVSNFVLSRIE